MGAKLNSTLNALGRRFFDTENAEFAWSFVRDLWKGLLILLGLRVTSWAISGTVGGWKAELLENIHFLISSLAFTWIGFMFLAKLFVSTIPRKLKEGDEN
jgi:hypothetical protein